MQLNFRAKLTPAALALRLGHAVIIAGADDGNSAWSADARVRGSREHSTAVWHEVRANCSEGSHGCQLKDETPGRRSPTSRLEYITCENRSTDAV